jgi:hypothetical protein
MIMIVTDNFDDQDHPQPRVLMTLANGHLQQPRPSMIKSSMTLANEHLQPRPSTTKSSMTLATCNRPNRLDV